MESNLITNEDLTIVEIVQAIAHEKLVILFSLTFFLLISLGIGFYLPNIYKSEALLAPLSSQNDSESFLKNYSNLASLAGINPSSSGNEGKIDQALKKVISLSFFEENVLPNIQLPDLMAFKSWEPISNLVQYNNKLYDQTSKTWKRKVRFPQQIIPSSQESYKKFLKDHIEISRDKLTGFVTLSIKHQSPAIAMEWIEIIVSEINEFYRLKDSAEAQTMLMFLEKQMELTNYSEVKSAIAELMKSQTRKLALIEGNEYYLFEYIDKPVQMEKKHSPNRALIMLVGALVGIILGSIVAIIKFFRQDRFKGIT